MKIHQSYHEILGHHHDFVVEYKFLKPEDGGRKSGPPYQGVRSDFWYYDSGQPPTSLFIIWPEFLDTQGNLILDMEIPVLEKGKARMWIISERLRKFHQQKIKVGSLGYFMEGNRKIAKCEVVEIAGLMTNPTSKK